MKKWILIVALGWALLVAVPTIPAVRVLLASPLLLRDRDPRGDACYILKAGNYPFRERLDAAADLYNSGCVSKIVFMRDDGPGAYNFVAKAHWTPTEWSLDYLIHLGVPQNRIALIDKGTGVFGTLQEARSFKRSLPPDLKRLVLVSSATHMRRSVLAFRRVLPPNVEIISCPATSYRESNEYYYPLWIEYLKLAVYAVVAR